MVATSGMMPHDVISGSYSSGYCPGIAPGSLLIPGQCWPRNLNTFISTVQSYNLLPNTASKTTKIPCNRAKTWYYLQNDVLLFTTGYGGGTAIYINDTDDGATAG